MNNGSIHQPIHQTLKLVQRNKKIRVIPCGEVTIDTEKGVIEAYHPINDCVIRQFEIPDKNTSDGFDIMSAYVMNAAGKTVEQYHYS